MERCPDAPWTRNAPAESGRAPRWYGLNEAVRSRGGLGEIGNLRQRLDGFNAGAHHSPWFVLCDLDRHDCAPKLRHRLFRTTQAERMELRVAVRAVEAWLMADRQDFARFSACG